VADVNANIGVNIDTSNALAQLKSLQRQLAQFHTSVSKSSSAAASAQASLQKNLVNSINATGAFTAELRTVRTTSEAFTNSLEKNKFSMREYFRYAGAATTTFGKNFKSEFDTIGKVAEDRVKKLQTQYIKLGRDSAGAMKAIAVIPDQLDLSNHSTQLQIAAQRQAIFNQLLKQGSTNLLNFGKNTQWAGRQLMVGFTLPLASLGMVASKSFMDMEAAALKFRKVYGDLLTPKAETQKALEDVQELAKEFTKYGIAVSTTVGLAAEAAAAGFQGLDLQRQTTEATRLSILGQIDTQQALGTTIALQNAFKMSSEDLADSINFLNAVENQTVVSLDDITTAIPKVAPVIQQLGGDVKDLAFFMTAMKQGGINASEGANALKSGLASLINPTNSASKMLAGMGININNIVESNKGDLKATVIGFAEALDTLDPLNRARAIEQMFGKFQFARLSALFSNVIADGTQASRVLDLAGASIEELSALSESELGMTAESAMNKFKKAVEDLKVALVPVGQAFLEAVTPIIEFFGNILEKFANLSDGTKKAITVLTIAIGGIGPVALMAFGLLANGLANIIKLFATLRNGYLRLTGQSAVLGEQTQYMTNEQLEAAAAAHSLNQTHANLTQTFTAESSAVRALIAAYTDATTAAAKFAMANPGMMLPGRKVVTKKLAKGSTYVPGRGNKDTVPAVLTPGEAVIPRDVAQDPQFQPIIDAMVNGNLQGFNGGTPNAMPTGSQSRKQVNSEVAFSHITGDASGRGEKRTIQQLYDSNEFKGPDRKVLKSYIDAGMGKLSASAYSSLGFDIPKDLNSNLAVKPGVSKEAYIKAISKPGAINTMVQMLMQQGMSQGEAIRTAHSFRKAYKKEISLLSTPFIQDKDLVSKTKDMLDSGKYGKIVPLSKLNVTQRPSAGDIGKFISNKAATSTAYNYDIAKRVLKREKISLGKDLGSRFRTANQEISIFRDASGKIVGVEARDPATGKVTHRGANLPGKGLDMVRIKGGGRFGGYASLSSRIKGTSELDSSLTKTQSKKMRSFYEKLVVAKGEGLETKSGQLKKVTGQTGQAKPSGKNVASSPTDTRVIPKTGVRRVIPVRGMRYTGANEGYDDGSSTEEEQKKRRRFSFRKEGPAPIGPVAPEGATMLPLVSPLTPQEKLNEERRQRNERIKQSLKPGMGGVGASMGLYAGSMAIGSLPEFTGKALAQSTINFAAMGSIFGPWGAAAGAAIGLVSSGLTRLMEKQKQYKAMTEAVFKSSADVATFFGNAVVDTEIRVGSFSASLGAAGYKAEDLQKSFGYTNEELKTFIDLIASLPEKNPLKDIVDGLANEKNPEIIKKIAEAFVTTQVAIGQIKPEQAQKTLDLILAAAGHSAMVGSAFMSLKTQAEAIAISLKNASDNSVALGRSLTQLLGAASNATSLENLTAILDGIAASGISAAAALSSMYYAYLQVGNLEAAKAVQVIQKVAGLTADESIMILTAITKGLNVVVDATTSADELVAKAKKFLNNPKLFKESKSSQNAIDVQNKKTIKSLKSEIDLLKAKKKIIDERIKQEQKISNEIDRQNEYLNDQADLDKKIVEAKIRGDYLEAATLLQEKTANTAEFNQETKVLGLQSQSDALGNKIDLLQESSNKVVEAVNANTTATKAGSAEVVKAVKGSATYIAPDGSSTSKAVPVSNATTDVQAYLDSEKPTGPGMPTGGKQPAKDVPLTVTDIDAALAWVNKESRDRFEAYVRTQQQIPEGKDGILISAEGSDGKTYTYNMKKDGQFIRVQKKALGGPVRGSGTATSDSIPAYLSNGEYVVKADSVKKYGVGTFDALNAQKFKVGGMAGAPHQLGMGSGSGKKMNSFQKLMMTMAKDSGRLSSFLGLGSLYKSLAGQGNTGDKLATAMIPVGGMSRVAKGAGSALGKGVGAVAKESEMLKYFIARGSDGDITMLDQIMAATIKGKKKDVRGQSLVAHDPFGFSTLEALFSSTGPRATKDMLGLSLMLAAKESGITKTGIGLLASADRSMYSEMLVKSLEKRGLGNVIGLPERDGFSTLGDSATKALKARDKQLELLSGDEDMWKIAFEVPELALNASREALSNLLKTGYDQSQFKELLKIFKKSVKGKQGFAMGGLAKLPKFHDWNGPVPGTYGQELPAMLKSGTEGIYQEGYINDLKQAASNTTNSASSVYNVSMNINGADSDPKQIAEEVMKKMQVLTNKNNKTNAGLR
jgi:TP901 family phage tail tape measure protein